MTEEEGKWIIEIPEQIMNEILGSFFNKKVEIEGIRMKRERLLKRILLESKENIRLLQN